MNKVSIDLAQPEQKTQVGTALMAINQVLAEAAKNNENLSFLEILKRSIHRKAEIETEIQNKQLTDGTNTTAGTTTE